jgi:hypothetical protein
MATYADLKTRIADELSRDDMGTGGDAANALTQAISSAIAFYADEALWFNHNSGTRTTTNGVGTISLPSTVRVAATVTYLSLDLLRVPLEVIEQLTDTGIPTRWAQNGDLIQLWPIPDGAYTLSVYGIASVAAPTADGDSTIWTNEAYDLIAARAKVNLLRFPLRDAAGLALAMQEEAEALSKLRRESRKRRQSPLRSYDFPRSRYNINTDR